MPNCTVKKYFYVSESFNVYNVILVEVSIKMKSVVNPYPITTKRPFDPYRKSTVDCGPGHSTFAAVHSEEND